MQMTTLAARVGRRTYPATSWEQVSIAYRKMIDHLGIGASQTPRCEIIDANGRVVAHVSYNGRVWAGSAQTWVAGSIPLYDPR